MNKLEELIAKLEELQAHHDFVGRQWRNNKTQEEYNVVGLALDEVNCAPLIIYQKLVEAKTYPEPHIPSPMWVRTVQAFLNAFTPLERAKKTSQLGYDLTGATKTNEIKE